MDNLVAYFNNIVSGFKDMKVVTILALAFSALTAVCSAIIFTVSMSNSRDEVYVIEQGSAVRAVRTTGKAQKDLETRDHVIRFHELMFNLSPSAESIKRNVDRALVMSDKSAYDYWMDMSERGFYQRLVSANISQQIVVDSVKLDLGSYPYQAVTSGKVYLLRESNITSYDFESNCRLIDCERSENNPHGLMIEKFTVTRNTKIGTKKRN